MLSEPPGCPSHVVEASDAGRVREQLEAVLRSKAFLGSRRSQAFLRYVVEAALDRPNEPITERDVAIALFNRRPDYDSTEDSIVRVAARDVRKRLSAYYVSAGHEGKATVIDIPVGSYQPSFQFVETRPASPVTDGPAEGPRRHRRLWVVLALAISLAAVLLWRTTRPVSALDQFWGPFLDQPGPVLFMAPASGAFFVSRDVFEALRSPKHAKGGPVRLPPVGPDDLVRLSEFYHPFGDVRALYEISTWLERRGQITQYAGHRTVTNTDPWHGPAVLIGAYGNPWNLHVSFELRYNFSSKGPWESRSAFAISDRKVPGRQWSRGSDFPRPPETDYALISRMVQPGRTVIAVGGLSPVGTQAAAQFVIDPVRIRDLTRSAPAGWPNRTLQAVLEIKFVNGVPASPRVVAAEFGP